MLTRLWQGSFVVAWTLCIICSSPIASQDAPAPLPQTYLLKHRAPSEVARALQPLLGNPKDYAISPLDEVQQLVVAGPSWVQETTREVIEQLDRPSTKGKEANANGLGPNDGQRISVVAYQCPATMLLDMERRLSQEFGSDELSLSRLPGTEVMFIRTSQTNHHRIAQWLSPSDDHLASVSEKQTTNRSSAESPWPPMAPRPIANPSVAELPSTSARSIASIPPAADRSLDSANLAILQRLLSVPGNAQPNVRRELALLMPNRLRADLAQPDVLWLVSAVGEVRLTFQASQNQIQVDGPSRVVHQVEKLIQSFSSMRTGPEPERKSRVLILRKDLQPTLIDPLAPMQPIQPSTRPDATTLPARMLGIKQVSYTSQPPPSAPSVVVLNVQPPDEAGPPQPLDDDPNRPRLPQFDGVQIESLPDLDAIILRGRNAELDQLTEIIKQLEQVSELTKPTIEIVPLEHASADRVAKLIEQTQVNLIGTRQGRATVTSLAKPNALLVIGWGDAVLAIKELIEKLDQPVPTDSQFLVIRLKYATAIAMQTTLQSFFATRTSLGPVIQATADARTNSIVVHGSPRDLEEVRMLVAQLDVPIGSAMQRAKVFPIQHSLAADIAQTLQQAIQGTGTASARNQAIELLDHDGNPIVASGVLDQMQITVNDRNNSIIVTAPIENLGLIDQLIHQLDTPGMIAKIKIFPIENGDAASLVEVLRSLIPSQAATATGSQLSSSPGESSLVPLRFTVEPRGNNIVATGSEGDLTIVEALIFRLDEKGGMQRKSTVYQLKNSPAIDVALTINEFLRNKRQVENAAPGQSNPFDQLEKEVVVVPEPVANKLVLSATPRYYDEISDLIEKLDQQPPQVMIQVLIAEVALGQADEFGVEVGLQDSVLFDRSLLGNIFSLTNTTTTSTPAGVVTDTQQTIVAAGNEPGFNFNSTAPLGNSGSARSLSTAGAVGGQGISNFSLGRSNSELGFGGLVLSASSQNVSFLLRALQESRRLDVLSRPQILTLDNQPAFIQVGQRVPRIVGSIVNQNGQQNNVTLENVGLIIGVTPRISPEGNVVMEIDAEKSSLGSEAEGIPVSVSANGTIIRSPRIETTQAQATVSAADGETIILGGLITKSNRQQHRKVPVLGDLPILKHLFRYDSVVDRRTELLIVLTPHVVRSVEDMDRLKEVEVARMSWCAADVFEVHGDIHVASRWNHAIPSEGNWEIVYPDVDPRGTQNQLHKSSAPGNEYMNLPPASQSQPMITPAVEPELSQNNRYSPFSNGAYFPNFDSAGQPVVPATSIGLPR